MGMRSELFGEVRGRIGMLTCIHSGVPYDHTTTCSHAQTRHRYAVLDDTSESRACDDISAHVEVWTCAHVDTDDNRCKAIVMARADLPVRLNTPTVVS